MLFGPGHKLTRDEAALSGRLLRGRRDGDGRRPAAADAADRCACWARRGRHSQVELAFTDGISLGIDAAGARQRQDRRHARLRAGRAQRASSS